LSRKTFVDPSDRSHDWRMGSVVGNSGACLFFFDDDAGQEVSLGYNSIRDWRFQNTTRQALELRHLERDDEIEVEVPKWLLRKEGLI